MSTPHCRLCDAPLHTTVVDLGDQPLANSYLDADQVDGELRYPLHARLCESCGLVQVDDVVPAEQIFGDYAYFSSFSDSWVDHAHRFADVAAERFALQSNDLVVELASNDGYLLQWFVQRGIRVLGVEPARNVAAVAAERGIPTTVRFFGTGTATDIRSEHGAASLIVANNVLAHVPDLNDFIGGMAALLAHDGVISIEFPHLLNLVQQTQFDTIYHEHYSYFSLLAATNAVERHGLLVVDVEELPTHGGSLRLWVRHATARAAGTVQPSVPALLSRERDAQIDRPEGYGSFTQRVHACRDGLLEFLSSAASSGRRIAAYGAAAKGNTLLNFSGVTTAQLRYVVDRSVHKQGKLLPGSHIPVMDPSQLIVDQPDLVLILPWNLRREISEQMSEIRDWGARFVTAVPSIEEF